MKDPHAAACHLGNCRLIFVVTHDVARQAMGPTKGFLLLRPDGIVEWV
jgi:hypothetical protein